MTQEPNSIETAGAGVGQSDSAEPYSVGYGKPPLHSRVKTGQVLNPRGRPKGSRNLRTVIEEAISQRVTIRQGRRTRTATKFQVMLWRMTNDAVNGNAKAQNTVIGLLRQVGILGEVPESSAHEPVTGNDAAVIADYLQRLAAPEETTSKPADKPTGDKATPTNGTKK